MSGGLWALVALALLCLFCGVCMVGGALALEVGCGVLFLACGVLCGVLVWLELRSVRGL